MNKEKLLRYSQNPDGIRPDKVQPAKQIAKGVRDDRMTGKRVPRGRAACDTLALRAAPGRHRWGKEARNPAEGGLTRQERRARRKSML